MDLESEIMKYKQKLNDMASERDADKTRLQGEVYRGEIPIKSDI